jgi:alpha-beta hydrolase superfamily lysophospholipase
MKQVQGTLKTADALLLHTEAWLPEGELRAVVLIAHGYAEHIGRYAHVADRLVSAGYAVYGLDHRGHGQSGGVRVHFEDFNYPIIDLKLYFDQIKAAHSGKPMFLYGHSMGSLIALEFALRYQEQLAGLILSGTAVSLDETAPKAMAAVSSVLNALLPRARLVPEVPATGLSHDPAVVSGYTSDPNVVTGPLRVRMGYQMMTVGQQIRARAASLRLPLLILHGSDDPVTPVSGSRYIAEHAGSANKTLKIYPGMFHEVHNEVEKETVLNDLVTWLNGHTGGSAA